MSNVIKVSVLGDVKDIAQKMGKVEQQLGGFGKKMGSLGKVISGALAGAAVGQVFKDIVGAASNAQQSLGATETVFGKWSNTVIQTSNEAATQFGLSANEYRENANILGSVLGNLGVKQSELGGKTKQLIGTGADLAATFGGTTKSAVEALTAAYKGEYEQMERYGVSIKASDVSTLLAAKGQDKLTGAALKAAQQQAVSELITRQTAKTTGAFAKETDTLAHQQQVLAAKVENAKAKIGTALLPILTKLAAFVSDTVLPKLEEFGAWFSENILPKIKEFGSAFGEAVLPKLQQFGEFLSGTVVPALASFAGWLQQNASWLMPIAVGITAIVAAWKAYQTYLVIVSAVTKAYTAVQAALNVVMSLNPIGILVLAIVGLIAAFVYLWKTNDSFREAVTKAWNAIKSAASSVFGWLKSFVSGAFQFIKDAFTKYTPLGIILSHWGQIKTFISNAVSSIKTWVSNAWSSVKTATSTAWNAVKTSISNVWDGIKTATSTAIGNVVTYVSGIKGKITSIFSGAASWLLSAGENILRGLLRGIENMIGKVKNKLNQVTNLIPDWKGPAPVDKKLLFNAGRLIMGGLINGIDKEKTALRRTLKAVTKMVTSTDVGVLSGGAIKADFGMPAMPLYPSGGMSAANSGIIVQVNVPPTADKASIGREIKSALDEWARVSGR